MRKNKYNDIIKVALIAAAVSVLVQMTFLSFVFLVPETALTRIAFSTFVNIKNELKEASKIGTSLAFSQFNLFSGLPSRDTDLKVIRIKAKPKEFRHFLEPIETWTKAGVKTPDVADWAKATFFYDDKEWPVEIKLAGKRVEHWSEARKSFSIKFPKEDMFFGQREIKLYPPCYKGGIVTGELLFWMASKVGLIAPRSEYVILDFNGVDQGVYFAVEDYRGEMLAWNKRPDTSPMYDLEKDTFHAFGHSIIEDGLRRASNFSPLVRSEDPITSMADNGVAAALEWAFYSSKDDLRSKAGKYLDMDQFAAFEAIRSIYQDTHGEIGSSRLYYNPTSGKIEPVIWDAYIPMNWLAASPEATIPSKSFPLTPPYEFNQFLRDPDIHLKYNKYLYQLASDDRILKKYDEIFNKVEDEYLASPVRKLEFTLGYLSRKELEHPRIFLETNLENIRATLRGDTIDQGVFALAVANEDKKEVRFDMEILTVSDLLLKGLEIPIDCDADIKGFEASLFWDSNKDKKWDAGDHLLGRSACENGSVKFNSLNKRFYSPRDESFKPQTTREAFFVRWDATGVKLDRLLLAKTKLDLQNLVMEEPYSGFVHIKPISELPVLARSYFRSDHPLEYAKKFPTLLKYENGKFMFRAGMHVINETIVLPENEPVVISEGTLLRIAPDRSILIRGELSITGSQNRPVVVECSISGKHFGTFAVLGHNAVIDHLVLRNGNEDYLEGAYLSGQLSVYNGDLTLTNSEISGSASDDGLNVKYGNVLIKGNLITYNAADAMDLDFCTGEVSNNIFKNNNTPNGDAIDVSGSTVLISGNQISNFGDKGISVGEDSYPVIFDNLIHHNNTGVAIKDRSLAKIYSSTIAYNDTGISLYQKKPMFGGGHGEVYNSILMNSKDVGKDDKSDIKAYHSTSALESLYGFKQLKPNFSDSGNGHFDLAGDNDPFLLKGANKDFIKDFKIPDLMEYPLGALSFRE